MQSDTTIEQGVPTAEVVKTEAHSSGAEKTFGEESDRLQIAVGNLGNEFSTLVASNPEVDLSAEKKEMYELGKNLASVTEATGEDMGIRTETTSLESTDAQKVSADRIETPDGQHIYLFRYDNPQSVNKSPNSNVSKDGLVGSWFTDSPQQLKTYTKSRLPGGNIMVLEVPKDQLEAFRASNHAVAKDMDIEPIDNFIIPPDLLESAQTFPLEVATKNPNKFLFSEWQSINGAIDGVTAKIKTPEIDDDTSSHTDRQKEVKKHDTKTKKKTNSGI